MGNIFPHSFSSSNPCKTPPISDMDYIKKRHDISDSHIETPLKHALIECLDKTQQLQHKEHQITQLEIQITSLKSALNSSNEQVEYLEREVCECKRKYSSIIMIFFTCLLILVVVCVIAYQSLVTVSVAHHQPYPCPSIETCPVSAVNSHYLQATSVELAVVTKDAIKEVLLQQGFISTPTSVDKVWDALATQPPRAPMCISMLVLCVMSYIQAHFPLPIVAAWAGVVSVIVALRTTLQLWKICTPKRKVSLGVFWSTSLSVAGWAMYKNDAFHIPAGVLTILSALTTSLLVSALLSPSSELSTLFCNPKYRLFCSVAAALWATALIHYTPFSPLSGLVIACLSVALESLFQLMGFRPTVSVGILITVLGGIWNSVRCPTEATGGGWARKLITVPDRIPHDYMSDIPLWSEWTAACGVCLALIYLLISLQRSHQLCRASTSYVIYSLSLVIISVGIHTDNFSAFFFGHIGLIFYTFLSPVLQASVLFILNAGLLFASAIVTEKSIFHFGYVEIASDIVLGPLGVLVYTIKTVCVNSVNCEHNHPSIVDILLTNFVWTLLSAALVRPLALSTGILGIIVALISLLCSGMRWSILLILLVSVVGVMMYIVAATSLDKVFVVTNLVGLLPEL